MVTAAMVMWVNTSVTSTTCHTRCAKQAVGQQVNDRVAHRHEFVHCLYALQVRKWTNFAL